MAKNPAGLQGMALSLLLHAVAGGLFVFVIPLQKIPDRPEFVFWGAFLGSIERPVPSYEMLPTGRSGISPIAQVRTPDSPWTPVKPGSQGGRTLIQDMKTHHKTTFLREDVPASVYQSSQSRHYQETKVEYQPLRVHPYSLP